MAFRTQKISQMTPKGANLEATDLIEVSTIESGSYVTRSITGQEIIDAAVGNVDWGDIGGTLSAQTDLQSALDAKQDDITLTTTGSSGASTLVGSTLNVPNYTLSGLGGVPTSRTLTINGVTQDLSANRTFTISTGITIGSTAITSGTVGRILFEGAGNVVQESSSLFWDNTNGRLGIGTSSPSFGLDVNGTARVQDNLTIVKNQNTSTIISINNTNNSASSEVSYNLTSSNGTASFAKKSALGSVYKIIAGNDAYIYNGTSGDISILNDTTGRIKFAAGASSTAQMSIFSTGNVGINTTTDAGYKLDVNGTSVFRGTTTISQIICSSIVAAINQNIEIQATWADSGYVRIRTITNKPQVLIVQPETNLTLTSGTHDTQRILHTFAPTSGTAVINALTLNQTINQTGGANGITRGLYVNPTLTAAADFRAIETTSGRVIFGNLPTSSAGLPTGAIWNDAGTLKIV